MLKQNKRKLVVDIETDSLDATVIHVAVTKDIDTKEVRSLEMEKILLLIFIPFLVCLLCTMEYLLMLLY